jgi:hypothetical protein
LWTAIQTHNSRGIDPIDVVRVGGPADLPLGTKDPALLLWAERNDRILVARDYQTLPGHLADHLRAGHSSPGIFSVRPRPSLPGVVDFLIIAAYASNPDEWRDAIWFIP